MLSVRCMVSTRSYMKARWDSSASAVLRPRDYFSIGNLACRTCWKSDPLIPSVRSPACGHVQLHRTRRHESTFQQKSAQSDAASPGMFQGIDVTV